MSQLTRTKDRIRHTQFPRWSENSWGTRKYKIVPGTEAFGAGIRSGGLPLFPGRQPLRGRVLRKGTTT